MLKNIFWQTDKVLNLAIVRQLHLVHLMVDGAYFV